MDRGNDIAVDEKGYAYITGTTSSDNYPAMHPYQSHQTGWDAFVTKLELPIQLDVPAEPIAMRPATVSHTVSPNPAHDNLRCSFTLPRAATLTVQIYSTDGPLIAVPVCAEQFEAGPQIISIPVAELPAGVYTLHVLAGEGSFTEQFVVVR
jgi:hypothetical protein